MAKFDIATLAMSIMSHQSEIAELGPTKDQVPQLLMKYLEDQIETDVKTYEETHGYPEKIFYESHKRKPDSDVIELLDRMAASGWS